MAPADDSDIMSEPKPEVDRAAEENLDEHHSADHWYLADTHQEKLSFSAVAPVDVQIRQLNVRVESGRSLSWLKRKEKKPPEDVEQARTKKILADVDADFPRATLTGIVGSSGSGKTTLLNVLSHRMRSSNLDITGQLLYNDSESLSTVTHAYVTQTDVLLPTLTVRETLMCAADLRLPSSVSKVQRATLVEEIILELGLKECADTTVGDGFKRRGCSGGERRRVSLGVQMLGNPSVLFLDEPTTGLDATSAFQLVKTLQSIARKGRTIIMTLHQPRSEVFFMLDRVALLAQGKMLYTGKVDEAVGWFEGMDAVGKMEDHVNPADFLIGAAAIDSRTGEAERESRARVQTLSTAWKDAANTRFPSIKSKASTDNAIAELDIPHEGKAPIQRTVYTLVMRTFKTSFRDPMGLSTSWIEAALMGLVVGLVFLQLPESLAGIRSRQAACYTAVGLQGYLMVMFEVYRLSVIEMPVFDREHSEGVVGVLPFLLSYRFSHFFLEDIIVPLIFSVISYWLMGLAQIAERFFIYFAVVLMSHLTSVTFAALAVSVARDFATATLLANLSYTVHTFACGFFIQADTIPIWLRWLKWTSQVFYGFTAVAYNEFHDRFYDCPSGDPRIDPACVAYRGDFIISSLAIPLVNNSWRIVPILAMLGFAVVYFLGSIMLLYVKKVDITMLGRRKKEEGDRKDKQPVIRTRTKAEGAVQGVDVGLTGYTLKVRTKGWGLGKKDDEGGETSKSKTILDGITTTFETGKVNVILGPSGSGKSSLLNLMAQRLRSTWRTTYEADGVLTLNGYQGSDLQALCSYVTQDDVALLPYLTVRETLRFSAGLRLPASMSRAEKVRKADEVLDKMGLRECAETLIGSELQKGISGGEKRRVSIAVQVLTEPQVLMLDEPTSGLDAFTASSIMDVLNQLASEGRTIITTLHQSSSQLFNHFGNILLLTKGGRVAYSGPGDDMLTYMAGVGFKCPSTMNPADFALDVVSVDLREQEQEEVSRRKVERLVSAFKERERGLQEKGKESRMPPSELRRYEKRMSPMRISLPILLRRGWLAFKRQQAVSEARFGNVMGLGIVSGIFFSPLGNDYVSVQNRVGCLQEILPLYFVGMLQNIAVYPVERDIFYREYDDGAYSISAFFLSYVLLELPCEMLACLMFSSLTAIATNLTRSIEFFFIVALNSLAIVNAGESLGIIFNTLLNDNTGLALNVTNVLLSVSTFMAGLMSVDQPDFFKGLNKLSPLGYAVNNLMPYAFRGQTFSCT
ncbi:hypothetical protein BDZ89DRAFT_1155194 [Hymenopellis radicata]|nr:hypothetical protein BDZ89DRAFT_1155194 [Hymenopellis radicata]